MDDIFKLIIGIAALLIVAGVVWAIVKGSNRSADSAEDAEAGVDVQGGGGPNPKLPPQ